VGNLSFEGRIILKLMQGNGCEDVKLVYPASLGFLAKGIQLAVRFIEIPGFLTVEQTLICHVTLAHGDS